MIVRVIDGDPNALVAPIRGMVRALDPMLPVMGMTPMDALLAIGAAPGDVLRLGVGQGLALSVTGVVLGLVGRCS